MSNGALTKVTAKTAAEVCKLFPLGDEARKLLLANCVETYLSLDAEEEQLFQQLVQQPMRG